MLTAVEFRNLRGQLVLTLPLVPSRTQPDYILKNISGLGPVKADITYSSYASRDGSARQSSRVNNRNMVIDLGFSNLTTTSIAQRRRNLYGVLPPKEYLNIRILDDEMETVEIYGEIESCEPTIFQKNPSMQISILSNFPHFRSLTARTINTTINRAIPISYLGNSPAGYVMELKLKKNATRITITNGFEADIILKGYNGIFYANDVIKISTVPGDKYLTLIRPSVSPLPASILEALYAGSLNHSVSKYTTEFKVVSSGLDSTNLVSMTYYPYFVGV
jgi:hypothetical protein